MVLGHEDLYMGVVPYSRPFGDALLEAFTTWEPKEGPGLEIILRMKTTYKPYGLACPVNPEL